MTAESKRFRCVACGRTQRSNMLACWLCGSHTLLPLEPLPSTSPMTSMDLITAAATRARASLFIEPTFRSRSSGGLGAPPVLGLSAGATAPPLSAAEGLSLCTPPGAAAGGDSHPGIGVTPGGSASSSCSPQSNFLRLVPSPPELDPFEARAAAAAERGEAASNVRPLGLVDLRDVPVEIVERRRCGWGDVDRMFGGGVPLERVIVVGGQRGIGKTTWCYGVASRLGGRVLGVSTEKQTPGEIKRMVVQTGGDTSMVDVLESPDGQGITLEQVCEAAIFYGSTSIIVDSYQGLRSTMRGTLEEIDTWRIETGTELAQALTAAVFFLSQRTKDGKNAGSYKTEQLGGTVLRFEPLDALVKVQPDGKNRGGPVHLSSLFEFHEHDGSFGPASRRLESIK